MRVRSIPGDRFGRLTLVSLQNGSTRSHWHCLCDCGNAAISRVDQMKRAMSTGRTPSCGCWTVERMAEFSRSRIDLSQYLNQRFGRLLVTAAEYEENANNNQVTTHFICVCDCGSQVRKSLKCLSGGDTKSCGCWVKDLLAHVLPGWNFDHGHTVGGELIQGQTPIYQSWRTILDDVDRGVRRGIHRVCHERDARWDEFQAFLSDFGDIGTHETISRIDNQLSWSKENCYVRQGSGRKTAAFQRRTALPMATA